MDNPSLDPHTFTTPNSFTKLLYRDVYPAIDPNSPFLSQKGKVVIVTGASRGIGKLGFAASFARARAKAIIITARDVEGLRSTEAMLREISPETEVVPVALQVTSEDSVKAMFAEVSRKFGRADVLVNNAGINTTVGQQFSEVDATQWWGDIEVNLKGTALVCKHFLQNLQATKSTTSNGAGVPTIINVSSLAGIIPFPGMSAYGLSKLALLRLCEFIAFENEHVVCMALHPGIILSDLTTEFLAPFSKDTNELAGGAAVWLATDRAKFMNGRYLSANWDVNQLMAEKDHIIANDLLKVRIGELFSGTVAG